MDGLLLVKLSWLTAVLLGLVQGEDCKFLDVLKKKNLILK